MFNSVLVFVLKNVLMANTDLENTCRICTVSKMKC